MLGVPVYGVAEGAAAAAGSFRRAAVALREARRDAEKTMEDMVSVRPTDVANK